MTALARAPLDELTEADLDRLAELLALRLVGRLGELVGPAWLNAEHAAEAPGVLARSALRPGAAWEARAAL